MKFSQLIFGFLALYLSSLGLYASWTAQPKSLTGIIASLFIIWLSLLYIAKDFTNYSKYIKDNILKIDVKVIMAIRFVIAIALIGFSIYVFGKFWSGPAFYGFFLFFILALIYVYRIPSIGIYKDGKYLGVINLASIKVDKITLGKKKDISHIGRLKITKNGEELLDLALTAEGLMELKPDKLNQIFPDLQGKIERFEGLQIFKIGDYTVEYDFTKGYTYYDDNDERKTLDDCILSPNYTFCAGNIHKHD